MKRVKIIGLMAIVALIVMVILVIGYVTSKKNEEGLLTQKTIVKTLTTQGILIEEDKTKSSKDFKINGIKPDIFNVEKDKGTLLIYIFDTIEERIDTPSGFEIDMQNTAIEHSFKAKNAYLVYIPILPDDFGVVELESEAEIVNLITDIVFESFNDGKVVVYKGKSNSWEGTYTLKYYGYFWNDETGKLNYESYHQGFSEIQYTMDDIESVGIIDFEYETKSSGGSSVGKTLNKDGHLRFGFGGGNGVFPKADDEISFVIKWNDLEENMMLKVE